MAAGLNVYAVGRIANELRITAQLVLKIADELAIEPALTINDVPHFHRGDVNRIRSHVAGESHNEDGNRFVAHFR